jgi:hypothetical protein
MVTNNTRMWAKGAPDNARAMLGIRGIIILMAKSRGG